MATQDLTAALHAGPVTGVRWQRYFWALLAFWSVGIAGLAWWVLAHERAATDDLARTVARTIFEKDLLFRRWLAEHRGVYVEIRPGTPPNPYLAHLPERDITTPSGRRLTLVNPSYATRQLHELQRRDGSVIGHITSLKPIRPENRADPWETRALHAFEKGVREISSVEMLEGKPFMRIMRPLFVEESCLHCHRKQGYHVGDVRGGLSVSLPMQPFLAASRAATHRIVVGFGLTWIAGLLVMGIGALRLRTHMRATAKLERTLHRSEERFRLLFESAPGPLLVLEPSKGFIDCNDAALRILGAKAKHQLLRRRLTNFSPPQQPDGEASLEQEARLLEQALNQEVTGFEWTLQRLDGTQFVVEASATAIPVDGTTALLIQWHDITEKKQVERELHASSVIDELTGLYNRRGFFTLACQQMRIADRTGQTLVLIFADLDGMKRINDTFGHREGDRALHLAAQILRRGFRTSDVVARLGGDEFVGVALESTELTGETIIARLQAELARVQGEEQRYPLSMSFGLARYHPAAPCTIEDLLERGDRSMYEQKQQKNGGRP